MAKEFFKKNNVNFTEYNVAEDDAAREDMVRKSHQLGVPVIDVGGKIFVGFDKKGVAESLGVKV
jgi:glutaredoxin